VRDEHEMTMVTQARVSDHRRHGSNDDRRTRDEYRRTEGLSPWQIGYPGGRITI
jgi:hypothetical protein